MVICFLSQLQKLDDIAIVDEERDKTEKKLSGNYDEEDEPENNNNQKKRKVTNRKKTERYSS